MEGPTFTDPQILSHGTTTATIIHSVSRYWVGAISYFRRRQVPIYQDKELLDNPNINVHHGITLNNDPALCVPSTLRLDDHIQRSKSLSSQINLRMNVDITPSALTTPSFSNFNWFRVDVQLLAFALATAKTVRLFLDNGRETLLVPEKSTRAIARFIRFSKVYGFLISTMYAGFWTAPLSLRPSDIETLAVSRNVIAFAVATALWQYPKFLLSLSLNAIMSIHFFADLGVIQFRAWVCNRCLNSIVTRMTHSYPTPMTYRALKEHSHQMMDLIEQLVVDSSSIGTILSDSSELGKQFETTFYHVYFDHADSPFRRAKALQSFWPDLFLRSKLPSVMTANRSYQNPTHVPYDAEICPFTACLYHHNEAIALVMICMWVAYKELSVVASVHDPDLLIPSMDAESLVPSPGHIDIEDRYETFHTLCETLSGTATVDWCETMVQKANKEWNATH